MGSFANTLFTIMLGWFQGAASAIWSAFTTEDGGSLLKWIGNNWFVLVVVLCIAGLVTDFAVYLFRWQPFRVWKSFFRRRKQKYESGETEPEEKTEADVQAEVSGHLFRIGNQDDDVPASAGERKQVIAAVNEPDRNEEDELARWKESVPSVIENSRGKNGERSLVTNAGYVVPEDSPYRRPVSAPKEHNEPVQNIPEQDYDAEPTAARERRIMKTGRRRRLSVSDLFSDPEEELFGIEAPQNLIDRKDAYHEPVYPTGWKNSEDSGQ